MGGQETLSSSQPRRIQYSAPIEFGVPKQVGSEGRLRQALDQLAEARSTHGSAEYQQLSLAEKHLLRYYRMRRTASLGPRYGAGFALYLDVLPDDIAERCRSVMSYLKIGGRGESDINNILGAYASVLACGGDGLFGTALRYMIGWEGLGGYQSRLNTQETLLSQAMKWVTGETRFTMDYKRRFATAVNEYVGLGLSSSIKPDLSIDEWCSDPTSWGTSGSVYTINESLRRKMKLRITSGGKSKNVHGSKWVSALMLDPNDIRNILLSPVVDNAKMQPKVERTKIRGVVNSCLELYLKMSFVDGWLQNHWRGHRNNLLHSGSSVALLRKASMSMVSESGNWYVCFDMAKFDHQQPRWMLIECLSAIRHMIASQVTGAAGREMLQVMDSIIDTFSIPSRLRVINGREMLVLDKRLEHAEQVQVDGDDVIVSATKGLLSGWRWTSLLGTMISGSLLIAAAKALGPTAGPRPLMDMLTQGDDEMAVVASEEIAERMFDRVTVDGWDVKVTQSMVSSYRGEFLRKQYCAEGVLGYPARVIHSLIWSKEDQSERMTWDARMQELTSSWLMLAGRGCVLAKVLKHMRVDAHYAFELKYEDIDMMLHTPRAAGGCGVYPLSVSNWVNIHGAETAYSIEHSGTYPGLRLMPCPPRLDRHAIEERVAKAVLPRTTLVKEIITTTKIRKRKVRIITGGQTSMATNSSSILHPRMVHAGLWYKEVMRDLIKHKRIDEALLLLVPEHRALAAHVRSHSEHAWWIDWMLGDIDVPLPTLIGCDMGLIRYVCERLFSSRLSSLILGNKHISWGYWRAVCCGIELAFHSQYNKFSMMRLLNETYAGKLMEG